MSRYDEPVACVTIKKIESTPIRGNHNGDTDLFVMLDTFIAQEHPLEEKLRCVPVLEKAIGEELFSRPLNEDTARVWLDEIEDCVGQDFIDAARRMQE